MSKSQPFQWPDGKRMALSLTFDDARPSQLDNGIPVLDAHGVKATFYVTLAVMQKRLDDWRRVLANGHEIGNHSVHHPCTGNFIWSRDNALEDFTLETMEADLTGASAAIRDVLGTAPRTFAYPCGQKFVGRGETLQSYVPLVAHHFLAGRGFRDEIFNAPSFCDLAQACGTDSDDTPFEKLKLWLDVAAQQGGWVVFCSHDVGEYARQGMRVPVLDELCRYAADPANGIWIDTVATIAEYIRQHR
jgi:peptidoglycan-N-acetylglucosamine deacetylase